MNNKSKAPNFLGLVGENKEIALSDFAGKYLVIYFYPKDKTSGCTVESQDFRDLKSDFQKLNCEIVGVSRDSLKSHASFIEKESLNFDLISDPDETMCKPMGAVLYGLMARRAQIESWVPYGTFVQVLCFITLGAIAYAVAALLFGAIRVSDLKGMIRRNAG